MATSEIQTVNLPITQGDCLTRIFTFTDEDGMPVDISAWDFKGQIRDLYDSTVLLAELSFSQVGLPSNQIEMSLTAVETESLPIIQSTNPGSFNINKLSYDIKATIDGCVYTIQRGTVFVSPSVTKS